MTKRASRAEHERRLAELGEGLARRVPHRSLVEFAMKRFGLGERAAQAYVAEARERLAAHLEEDKRLAQGEAAACYDLLYRRQLAAGDLKGARATLDKLVLLLGLATPPRATPLTLSRIAAEIARLEAELAAFEEGMS